MIDHLKDRVDQVVGVNLLLVLSDIVRETGLVLLAVAEAHWIDYGGDLRVGVVLVEGSRLVSSSIRLQEDVTR